MGLFFKGSWTTGNLTELLWGLEMGRRSLSTRLAAMGSAERCNDVNVRCTRLKKQDFS
jgi:hypothetical protein